MLKSKVVHGVLLSMVIICAFLVGYPQLDARGETEGQPSTIILPGDGATELVPIHPGSALIDSPDTGQAAAYAGPRHPVTLTQGFLLGKNVAGQAKWQVVIGSGPSYFTGDTSQLSLNACQTFIQKLNALGQKKFRLPTDAEWEKACLKGSKGAILGSSPQTVARGGSGTPCLAWGTAGYHFAQWSDGSTLNPRTETNVTADVTVVAAFVSNTAVALTLAPSAHGSLAADHVDGSYFAGQTALLTATPDAGYCVKAWTGTDNDASTANANTVTMAADKAVTVAFELVAPGSVIRTFAGHTQAVTSVAFSPDGTQALTGSEDETAKLWDVATGATLETFTGYTQAVTSVAFGQDGTDVLTASFHTASLLDAATGTLLQPFTWLTTWMNSVAFSPDGTKVLTGGESADYANEVKLWAATTGTVLQTFTGHASWVNAVAFAPDGTKVLTASSDNTAKLWDAATAAILQTFAGHAQAVTAVAFSPDGTKVLTGSADNTAQLWDAATAAILQTFTGHVQAVTSAAFTPDGTKVLTGSADNTAKLWDAATGAALMTFTGHTQAVTAVAFGPDGTKALTGSEDDTAKLWLVSSTPAGTVPYVAGKTQSGAEAAIIGAGFVLGVVTQEHSATVPAGDVISQNPAPLANGLPGAAVDLVVSAGS